MRFTPYTARVVERTGRVTNLERLSGDVVAIDVTTVEPRQVQFAPGQFVSLRVNRGRPTRRRSFSIASDPDRRDGFTLVVKPAPGSRTMAFLSGLAPGTEIQFYGPMGYFLCDPTHRGDIVFVATGVGISAIWPMLRQVAGRDEPGQIRLYWGLRHAADLFWQERLAALASAVPRFRFDIVLSGRGEGHVTPRVLGAVDPAADPRPVFYLCGNGAMIDDVVAGLADLGIDRRHIRTEVFYAVPHRLVPAEAAP